MCSEQDKDGKNHLHKNRLVEAFLFRQESDRRTLFRKYDSDDEREKKKKGRIFVEVDPPSTSFRKSVQ